METPIGPRSSPRRVSQSRPAASPAASSSTPKARASAPRKNDDASVFTDDAAPPRRARARSPRKARLPAAARAAEGRLLDTARAIHAARTPEERQALLGDARRQFGDWQLAISRLAKTTGFASPEVKSFLSKVHQELLLSENVTPSTDLAEYRRAVEQSVGRIFMGAEQVLSENPLVTLPPLVPAHTPEALEARGVPMTDVEVPNAEGGTTTKRVRSDAIVVFCRGVIAADDQFQKQEEAAIDAGILAVRAPTGTFMDPEKNAEVIADTVRDARARLGNPDAKVILVGYSQGSSNVLSFLRDKDDRFAELRAAVAAVHMLHPSARGSQLIDALLAMSKGAFGDEPLDEGEQTLVAAAKRALLGELPQPSMPGFVSGALGWGGSTLRRATSAAGQMHWSARAGSIAASAGRASRDFVLRSGGQALGRLIDARLDAVVGPRKEGLSSLSTEYGSALTSDPLLHERTAHFPIINTVGAVPAGREAELVSPLNRLNFRLISELGLENDGQMSLELQRLEPVLPTAVDLPPQAVGHWGVAGLSVPGDHDERYYRHYSPTGLTRAMLSTLQAADIL